MSKAKFSLSHWNDSKRNFCQRVASTTGTLKILLKTKDEQYFLDSWIQHHAKIVGLENLIIFDNGSSNERVAATYEKFQSQIPIVQFSGFHNSLHYPDRYPEIYECLKQSCEFFLFLDTDEFLVLVEGDTHISDDRILDFLKTHRGANVFPGSWLENLVSSEKRFKLGRSLLERGHGLFWGKPIIRSQIKTRGCLLHNVEVDSALLTDEIKTNFFVLHMKNLYPEQRIEANINKLKIRGFASPDDTLESILAWNLAGIKDYNTREYVSEIRKLVKRIGSPPIAGGLENGCVEFGPDGTISYPSETEATVLRTFLTTPRFIGTLLRMNLSQALKVNFSKPPAELKRLAEFEEMFFQVKRSAELHVPPNAKVAIINKGDPRLLEISNRHVFHFPLDEAGEYAGFYPSDDVAAICLLTSVAAKGIEYLIIPATAFWWLDHYSRMKDYLNSQCTIIWRSAECIIYQLSRTESETCIS